MTHREVLESAKAVWLAAALRDQRQFPGKKGTTGDPECAATILAVELDLIWRLRFTCPEHSDYPGRAYDVTHFNDIHEWDWLTLAQKLGEEPYVLGAPDASCPLIVTWEDGI